MRLLVLLPIIVAVLPLLGGCEKESVRNLNCERFRNGIITNDKEAIKGEINRITLFYRSDPAASDTYGHRLNIEDLVRQLNQECNLTATAGCYNCIMTLPPQTEIFVTVSAGSTTVRRVIDLTYDRQGHLIFSNMHN